MEGFYRQRNTTKSNAIILNIFKIIITFSLFLTQRVVVTTALPRLARLNASRVEATFCHHSSFLPNISTTTKNRKGVKSSSIVRPMSVSTENNNNDMLSQEVHHDSFPSYISKLTNQLKSSSTTTTGESKGAPTKSYNVILGNEAGDMDSIVSALTLSYVHSLLLKNKNDDNNNDDTSSSITRQSVPVVSIPREDMPLRRDVLNLLRMSHIDDSKDLFYLDDDFVQSSLLTSSSSSSSSTTTTTTASNTLTLVDHNKLRSSLSQLYHQVVEILDHHQDEGHHIDTTTTTTTNNNTDGKQQQQRREIAFEGKKALVGSTCTLIVERLQQTLLQLKEEENQVDNRSGSSSSSKKNSIDHQLDPNVAMTLLGVILVDTMNMSPEADKGTDRDEKAIDYLMTSTNWNTLLQRVDDHTKSILFPNGVDDKETTRLFPDRERFFNYLQNSKFDASFWQEMTVRDALRIDYKRFEVSSTTTTTTDTERKGNVNAFGLSSVLLPIHSLLTKGKNNSNNDDSSHENFYRETIQYMKNVDIPLLGVLSMVIENDSPRRELCLIGRQEGNDGDNDWMALLKDFLVSSTNESAATFLQISVVKEEEHIVVLPNEGKQDEKWKCYWFKQGNPKGSRKQVAPVLLDYFS